jgi:hypothetical protein
MRRSCAEGDGRLLFVQVHDRVPPHTGRLVLPGGGIESGKAPEAAARRRDDAVASGLRLDPPQLPDLLPEWR